MVDHTRNITKEIYSELEFWQEYQEKVDKDLKDEPVNVFIKDLRAYILHIKVPFVGTHFQTQQISPLGDPENLSATTIRLTFSKDELLKSDRWTKPAKNYLETQGDLVFLDALIDEYYSLIKRFHLWLNTRQREMHESEYSWLLSKWDELYQELNVAVSAQRLD